MSRGFSYSSLSLSLPLSLVWTVVVIMAAWRAARLMWSCVIGCFGVVWTIKWCLYCLRTRKNLMDCRCSTGEICSPSLLRSLPPSFLHLSAPPVVMFCCYVIWCVTNIWNDVTRLCMYMTQKYPWCTVAGFMWIVLFESVTKFAASLKEVSMWGWWRIDHAGPTLNPYHKKTVFVFFMCWWKRNLQAFPGSFRNIQTKNNCGC